jgi:hypothetical protein
MPFIVTKFDYGLFLIALIVFTYSFFFYPNIQIFICSIICIYEMFQIFVLPGKPRLREIDKRLFVFKIKLVIRNKMKEGMTEYYEWNKNRRRN